MFQRIVIGIMLLASSAAHAVTSTTSLTASPNPATVDQSVTLTATVKGSSPAGTVTFKDGTTTLGTGNLNNKGIATLATTFKTAAGHSLTAAYAGNASNTASTSSAVNLTVNKATTTTTLAVSPTTIVVDQSFTLTATISGSSTSGSVTFKDGTTTLGTVTIAAGKATLTTTVATAASHSFTAVYAGDANYNTSTSAAKAVTVGKATTTTTVTASPNPAVIGQPTTLTASITGTHPTGTVTFKDGTTTLGTGTIAGTQASFNATFNSSGTHSITAVYAGDVNYKTSTSTAINLISDKAPTVAITSPAGNTIVNAPGSITLTATAADADGTVNKVEYYQNGNILIGSSNSSPYSVPWNNIQAGTYQLTAKATDNQGVVTTSSAITFTVNAAPTVNITNPVNNSSATSPANLTISAIASDSDGTITKVEFYNGANLIGTATAAPYSTPWNNVAPGSYTLFAKATDNNNATTTSGAINITVNSNPAPTVTLTANPTNATAPATVNLTAAAADSNGTISKVEFYNGTQLLYIAASAPYTYSWTNVLAGDYSITARAYDNNNATTDSQPVQIAITQGTAQAYYVYTDQIGTPRLITDQASTKVWQWDNVDPFGNNATNDDPISTGTKFEFNPRFAGQYFDKETNLHYNYFRDFDPATGRYVQSDPIGLKGGINTYLYVSGSPLQNIDPQGTNTVALGAGAGGVVGGPPGAAVGAVVGGLVLGGIIIYEMCKDKACPPCRTVSGKTVPTGTIAYRPLDTPSTPQHGIVGAHYNLYKANQNPNNCQCFWQSIGAVPQSNLPPNAIPIEPFAN